MKKKIGIALLLIALIGGIGILGVLITRSFSERFRKIDSLEKQIGELREEQKVQKQYINYLVTYDWNMYFKKDLVSLRYPKFAIACDRLRQKDEIIDIKVFFERSGSVNCAELERSEQNELVVWPLELKVVKNNDGRFKSVSDVLNSEGISKVDNLTTEDSKTKYPRIGGGEFFTEWLSDSEKTRGTYIGIVFYPPKPQENYYPPITVIKSPNQIERKNQKLFNQYSFMNTYPLVDLILKSVQFP